MKKSVSEIRKNSAGVPAPWVWTAKPGGVRDAGRVAPEGQSLSAFWAWGLPELKQEQPGSVSLGERLGGQPGTKRREPRNLARAEGFGRLPGQCPSMPASCSPRRLSPPRPLDMGPGGTKVTQKPKMLHSMGNPGRGNSDPRYVGRALNKEAGGRSHHLLTST